MAEFIAGSAVHRPRNVDWKRAAALLYGDWGTSKAYVIGLAFVAAGFSSFPIILAVCALTGLVGINYAEICKYFPDGGGVYSAARSQGRLLAVVGALLLVAELSGGCLFLRHTEARCKQQSSGACNPIPAPVWFDTDWSVLGGFSMAQAVSTAR